MIEGVEIIELRTHKDNRGFFREVFRFPNQSSKLSVGQLSHSLVKEGVIKAWHGHVYQSQWNYVVSGQIKVGLYDNRKGSLTYKKTIDFIVNDKNYSIAYYFPPGVMHGYKCNKGPMDIIYVTSGVYDLDDEVRMNTDEITSITF